jgi:carbon-monoxide dehydrogenase medium subunit
MRTILDPTDLLLGVEVAPLPGYGVGYVKIKRGASSWPIATAACLARRDSGGRCVDVRLAVGGVNAVPLVVDVGDVLAGHGDDPDRLDLAASRVVDAITEPWSDVLAPAEYRVAVAKPVAKRAIERALHDARSVAGGGDQ